MKRRLNQLSCCGTGCLGFLLTLAIAFSIGYSVTGRYKPAITPPRLAPANNGYNDYVSAAQVAMSSGSKRTTNPGPANIGAIRKRLAASRNALMLLRIGLGKDCVAVYNRDPNTVYAEVEGFRELARLLLDEQELKKSQGDYAGVMESGLDGLQFSQDISRGGPLLHSLVGKSCEGIVERPMVEAVDHLTVDQCDRAANRLTMLLTREVPEADVLQEEKAFTLTTLVKMTEVPGTSSPDREPGPFDHAFGSMAWHFMRDRTLHEVSDHFDRGIAQARKPISHRVAVPEPTGIYSTVFAMSFEPLSDRFSTTRVHTRLLLCSLAIRSYRLKHGSLPMSWGELKLSAQATTDPCTGQPIVYRPNGNDYLLYSVGPDGKDDGGVPANENKSPFKGDLGVIGFRYNDAIGGSGGYGYRRVPHMKLPILPKGAPPLKN